jgi:hypothetical protein
MRTRQLGLSLMGLIMGAVILIAVLLVGMKLAPSYIEYFAIKKAVNSIASSGPGTVAEVRRSFENHATIDDISSVKGSDLEVTKDAQGLVIKATYRKEIKLVANIGIYIDFEATSKE